MTEVFHSGEVRAALNELQQYFSDVLPPLSVADSVEVLLQHDPRFVADEIRSWSGAQYQGKGSSFPLSDYLFHAVKKLYWLGEFKLVPQQKLDSYLVELKALVLEFCPAEDKELLSSNLDAIGFGAAINSGRVDVLHRQSGGQQTLATPDHLAASDNAQPVNAEVARGLRRFTLLLERMTSQFPAIEGAEGKPPDELTSQLVATAATTAQSAGELEAYLQRVRTFGGDMRPRRLFSLLADDLPGWGVPLSNEPQAGTGTPLEAMRNIVSLASDPVESTRRFREMVEAAIDQFNKGSLARSVAMFELADQISSDTKLEPHEVRLIRGSGHNLLNPEQLRKYTEEKDKHALLRKALNFFPALTSDALLTELETEEKRERRRTVLALYEVHGREGRAAALETLDRVTSGPATENTVFFVRNLLYLLSRIHRTDEPMEREIDIVGPLAGSNHPAFIVKEAIADLGQLKHHRAEKVLLSRFRDLESMLLRPQTSKYEADELKQLLDRTVGSLIRQGSAGAIGAVVQHGLNPAAEQLDSRGRLHQLSSVDLSTYPEIVERLIAAVRADLPKKVLGFFGHRNAPGLVKTIETLGSTSSRQVSALLEEVRDRFPDQEVGRTAATMLTSLGASHRAPAAHQHAPSLTGDLEVFGLPSLLQSLSESQVNGVLTVTDSEGGTQGTVQLDGGKFAGAKTGLLDGKDAIYQLFENAKPGNFSFVARPANQAAPGEPRADFSSLIFEAMRRHDELRRARLLVPETATLRTTGTKPQPHQHETDPQVIREVWMKASTGENPRTWESNVSVDSYRTWRLISHWIETGSLVTNQT